MRFASKFSVPLIGDSFTTTGGIVSRGPPCGPPPRLAQELSNAKKMMQIYMYLFIIVKSMFKD